MSGPTPTGNGCSLEDCYTNIFALTDIVGIKWRKFFIDPLQTNIDPLEDPILVAYAKCLQADILCVWRRVAKHSEARPTDISFGKELWVFWYGDQPSILDDFLGHDLKEAEFRSWEKDSMCYECRTLLFKALHNLIERCLLTKNFIRLGRWFVQPQDLLCEQSASLSFSFHFFLHGESTVCASIEVKQHPGVMYLTTTHLNHVQESGTQPEVILAPYGLAGTLTGVTYRDSDQATRKVLDDWKRFYPLKLSSGRDGDPNKLPNLVEVVVAGVRMKYPTCFVLLVDDRPTHPGDVQRPGGVGLHPGGAAGLMGASLSASMGHGAHGLLDDGLVGDGATSAHRVRPLEPVSEMTAKTNKLLSARIVEKVTQDSCITAGLTKRHVESNTEESQAVNWDFSDPTSKTNCNCARLRGAKNKSGPGMAGKQLDKKKGDKTLERQQSRLFRPSPFHRRNQLMDEYGHIDIDMFMPPRVPVGGANIMSGGAQPPVSQNQSQPTGNTPIPQVGTSTSSETGNISNVSMDFSSPASNAPSPLEDSHTHSQVENNAASMDPTMPTLSPHPPLMKHGDNKDASIMQKPTQLDPHANQTLLNISNANNTVLVNGVTTDTNAFHKPQSSVLKMENNNNNMCMTTNIQWGHLPLDSSGSRSNVNSWLRSQQKQSDHKTFKRPCLPTLNGEQENMMTDTLYNFDSVSSWSEYPLKKLCLDKVEMLNGIQDPHCASNFGQNHRPMKSASPQPPAADPYAFSDEASSTPATISRGSMRNSRDDIFQRPSPYKDDEKPDSVRSTGDGFGGFKEDKGGMEFGSLTSPPATPGGGLTSLTREEDLKPKETDLDNLFQSDSDNDNDDAFIQQSPPKSVEDFKSTKLPNTGPVDAIGVIELSRMYPTPPSLENNPALSPMTSIDATQEVHPVMMEGISHMNPIKTEVPEQSTFAEELLKDGVYKPDSRAQYPSSAKYAPVELYSAQLSPPPDNVPAYKPSWFAMPHPDKQLHVGHYLNLPSVENIQSIPSARMPSSAIEASPATFQNSVGQQRTPMSYELQSPASNASSYLNKTPNSNLNHYVGTNNQIPEAQSLLVNVVLSDSILNLFKDQNFDSCNICVCNMTIKGSDVGVYIPNLTGEQEVTCSCGFSAVMNKRFGHYSGLFYEDEVEITGIRDDRLEHRKPSLVTFNVNKVDESGAKVTTRVEDITQPVLQLLINQFTVPYPTCSTTTLLDKILIRTRSIPCNIVNNLQLQDGNEISYFALDQGRQAMEHCPNKLEDSMLKTKCLHKWSFLQGASQIPQNSLESVRLLKGLQPLLQDAIQNKRVTRLWEHTYKLQGPLTWIEFHQLAGRGTHENSEPQPIPSLLVGCEKDCTNISPFALKYWDKNILEPYGHRRDIAYVVVAPENDHMMSLVRPFFKELSTMYEWLRLGRHCPVTETLRDGILRLRTMQTHDPVDEWFSHIGDDAIAAKVRLYAQNCKHYLAPFLKKETEDLKMKFAASTSSQRPSHHRPPEAPTNDSANTSQSEDRDGETAHRDSHEDISSAEAGQREGPALVIYIVNPLMYGREADDYASRLSMIGLLRCYQEIVPNLSEYAQKNVYLQIIPVQTILDAKESSVQFQLLKNIAFSVFTSCRWNLNHSVLGRSLTGFGPAAAADVLLKRKNNDERSQYRLYNPPFVLAPLKDKQEQLAESCSERRENSTIMLCVYCLSEDQRWLLACCTDDRGETVETCTINIDIPNRNRRKKTSARKIGLGKLWDFILSVVSLSANKSCRVVIGRFGRIGHGELKGWSGLLSKKNIQRCNSQMRKDCSQCLYQMEGDYPSIVSACLISFEQHRSFNVMPDCVKSEEKQRRNCPLQTPKDASCSHILVFPTSASATAQSQTNQNQLDSTGGIGLGDPNLEFGLDLSDTNIMGDFENDTAEFMMDVFQSLTQHSPPGQDNPGSPGQVDIGGRNSPNKLNGNSVAGTNSGFGSDPQDETPNLLQQPLAMGYYLSTADTGPLPRWFWSLCPENEYMPVKCFKSALHIHVSTNQDDFMHTSSNNSHPLDSNLTCDVLRYVLEKYNALSWLTFDPAKNDRTSCLPIHFSVLMQLYHAINAYV